jgi:gluconate kinase
VKKLLGIVEGIKTLEIATIKREWKQRDNITMMLICSSIDKKYMNVLVNYKTSVAMWIHLIIVHEENSRENKHIM